MNWEKWNRGASEDRSPVRSRCFKAGNLQLVGMRGIGERSASGQRAEIVGNASRVDGLGSGSAGGVMEERSREDNGMKGT